MIKNKTRGTVVASHVKRYENAYQKARGLMFRRSFPPGHALVFPFTFPQRPWIHMLFVFFPVDMIFLNEDSLVVHLYRASPWEPAIRPPADISTLIELPSGAISKSKTEVGDEIILS